MYEVVSGGPLGQTAAEESGASPALMTLVTAAIPPELLKDSEEPESTAARRRREWEERYGVPWSQRQAIFAEQEALRPGQEAAAESAAISARSERRGTMMAAGVVLGVVGALGVGSFFVYRWVKSRHAAEEPKEAS